MTKVETKKIKQGGFTLIEVVLVLAIGGLIFLLAFIAFQQASTNRRDTQRRSDAARIISELQNAQGDGLTVNNQTKLTGGTGGTSPSAASPSLSTGFVASYLGGGLKGPNNYYGFTYSVSTSAQNPAVDQMIVGNGVKCATGANNQFATQAGSNGVIVGLEKGVSCRDDQ